MSYGKFLISKSNQNVTIPKDYYTRSHSSDLIWCKMEGMSIEITNSLDESIEKDLTEKACIREVYLVLLNSIPVLFSL